MPDWLMVSKVSLTFACHIPNKHQGVDTGPLLITYFILFKKFAFSREIKYIPWFNLEKRESYGDESKLSDKCL